MDMKTPCPAALSAPRREERLAALAALAAAGAAAGGQHNPTQTQKDLGVFQDVNNHIHTIYSFSPYSPAAAVWQAGAAGLSTAGIMDHDSIAGAEEFLAAGRALNLPVTVGVELRAGMGGSPFAGRRVNNPDQDGVVYMALHAIPHGQLPRVERFLAPLREARGRRNRAMAARLAAIFAPHGISLDYDADVLPLSQAHEGGSVTERHLLYALAVKLIVRYGPGPALTAFLQNNLGLTLNEKAAGQLSDLQNPHRAYDLLGVLKAELVSRFYIPATDECPDVSAVLVLSEEVGAVSAYAYLGDVGNSITGDKRAQAFEDAYLDELLAYLKKLGFRAVTYMPSRNTPEQLARLRALCEALGFMQISGEDINSPRQEFICRAMRREAYQNLVEAAWALIGHENAENGLFSPVAIQKTPDLAARIAEYARLGRETQTGR